MNHVLARSDRCPLDFNGPEREGRSKKAFTVQGAGVHVARLVTLRAGIRMEVMGLKRKGTSCTQIVKKMFKLPNSTSQTVLLEMLSKEIEEFQK